jgi:hypothetical protein
MKVGETKTIFFDGTDENGEHVGWIEVRELISAAPCVGCSLHRQNERNSDHGTFRVWKVTDQDGEREEFECFCTITVAAGSVSYQQRENLARRLLAAHRGKPLDRGQWQREPEPVRYAWIRVGDAAREHLGPEKEGDR